MKRRTALTAVPLGILGLTTAAQGIAIAIPASNGILDQRSLNYAIKLLVDSSGSGIFCSFVAFAHHISTLAAAGKCEQIRATTESLIDQLRVQDYCRLSEVETREEWIAEETAYFEEVVDMDDQNLSDAQREIACDKGDARWERREAKRKGGDA